MKTLLDNLTPEQQLNFLSVENKEGKTASLKAAERSGGSDSRTALEQYEIEAYYRVNCRTFASLVNNF
mgnify:CR=1 FL=1